MLNADEYSSILHDRNIFLCMVSDGFDKACILLSLTTLQKQSLWQLIAQLSVSLLSIQVGQLAWIFSIWDNLLFLLF